MTVAERSASEVHPEIDRYHVVDVREPHEFHGPLGYIEGAELVPLSTFAEHASKLDTARPLLLVCRSGNRSGKACELLAGLGIEDTTNLAGGMIGWNRVGLPVRHTEPRSLAGLVDQIILWVAQVSTLTTDSARDIFRDRLERQSSSLEAPTHSSVESLIEFVAESLAAVNPPDLELCLASFRRSLAVL